MQPDAGVGALQPWAEPWLSPTAWAADTIAATIAATTAGTGAKTDASRWPTEADQPRVPFLTRALGDAVARPSRRVSDSPAPSAGAELTEHLGVGQENLRS